MSMISELVNRLRVESKSMGKYGNDYMATLLMRSADTILMLSEKARTDAPQTDIQMADEIYPLIVVNDRYDGIYSHGRYTAWNKYCDEMPQEIEADDVACMDFWESYQGMVGLGNTPNEAIEDLQRQLDRVNEVMNGASDDNRRSNKALRGCG